MYFVTMTVIEWIDIFTRPEYRDVVIQSLKYCQKVKGLEVYGWCLMTNHLHMIIGSTGIMKIEDIVRDFKSYTARSIRKLLEKEGFRESRKKWMLELMYKTGKANPNNKDFQFWQQHNHPIELNSNRLMDQKLNYIHENPVKAGFVDSPEKWKYSSAADYAGVKRALIDIKFIE